MSTYVILKPTVTKTTLGLTKATALSSKPAPIVFTKHYTVMPGTPHISKLIYTLKHGYSSSMLPFLIGRTIVYRGGHTKGATILKTTSTGLVTLFYRYPRVYYPRGTKSVITYIPVFKTISLKSLIKYLSSGLYTLI